MTDDIEQNDDAARADAGEGASPETGMDTGADRSAPTGLPGLKAPDALRTIGEVATLLGIRQHVLRYWEEQFPTLSPVKRSGGRRYYRPEDVALLRTIHRLVDQEGYTLRGARLAIEAGAGSGEPGAGAAAMAARPIAPVAAAAPSAVAQPVRAALPDDTLLRLRQVRRMLAEALAAA